MTQEEERLLKEQEEIKRLAEELKLLKEAEKLAEAEKKERELVEKLGNILPKLDVGTKENGAVFYDNGVLSYGEDRQPFGSRELAKEFCKKEGNEHCKTLEDTPGGAWLNSLNLYDCLKAENADSVWLGLSTQFADQAKGEVNTFVKTESADHRTWEFAEKQTLRDNQKATQINYHFHPAPDFEVVKSEGLARPEVDAINRERAEAQQKEEQAKAEEQKEIKLPPKPKTKEELEREEQVAKKIVETVIDEAKASAIGAIGGSTLKTAYEAKKTLDEANEQAKQNQDSEQKHEIKFTYEGKKGTIEIEATTREEAKERVKALFENEDFRKELESRNLKAGESFKGKVEIAQPSLEPAKPSILQSEEEEKKKKKEQQVEIKIEEPKLSL